MIHEIHDLSDALAAPYLDVTSRDKRESENHFVAEGENVVYRLLASSFQCESVLCVDKKVDRLRDKLQPQTKLLVAPEKLLQQIVGFKFHSGVMAVGLRKPFASLDEVQHEKTILVLPEITDSANLGAILRVAAAFGVRCVLMGEKCRDPFTRQTVRTSMGTIFSLSLIRTSDIHATLRELQHRYDFNCIATVLDQDAESLSNVSPPPRTALLMGNEGPGLDRETIDLCNQKVTLPMKLATDSLNVVVAAGVFLYHFTRESK